MTRLKNAHKLNTVQSNPEFYLIHLLIHGLNGHNCSVDYSKDNGLFMYIPSFGVNLLFELKCTNDMQSVLELYSD